MLTAWDTVSTLDRMFDDVMGSMVGTAINPRDFDPNIDVRTTDTEVVFLCDVPGVKQDDLEVTLENHVLTIRGTRKFETKEGEQVMLGRPYGSFNRAFTLPDYVEDANLSAELSDGVLTIHVPKQATARPRKILISAGSKQLKE